MASKHPPSSLCSNCNHLGKFHLQPSQFPHKAVNWNPNSNSATTRHHNFGNGVIITDEKEAKERVLKG